MLGKQHSTSPRGQVQQGWTSRGTANISCKGGDWRGGETHLTLPSGRTPRKSPAAPSCRPSCGGASGPFGRLWSSSKSCGSRCTPSSHPSLRGAWVRSPCTLRTRAPAAGNAGRPLLRPLHKRNSPPTVQNLPLVSSSWTWGSEGHLLLFTPNNL